MSQPIYKVWRARYRESWYQLSKSDQDALSERVMNSLDNVGGKTVVVLDVRWSDDKWEAAGVEVYPNIEAVQKNAQDMQSYGWFRYVEGESYLATEYPSEES